MERARRVGFPSTGAAAWGSPARGPPRGVPQHGGRSREVGEGRERTRTPSWTRRFAADEAGTDGAGVDGALTAETISRVARWRRPSRART
eukprot:292503-Prorocentrum_minimum.AAC.1